MRVKSCGNEWLVIDRGVGKFFETSADAWGYVFLMREIRDNVIPIKMWRVPVRSLVPTMVKKRTVYTIHKEKALA